MGKVLVVDDEANIRKVLAAMLRRDGHEVILAADGEQGLAEFTQNGPDIVITDLKLPKMEGMELLRAVNTQSPDVPVIIITAHGSVDTAVEAIKAGAFDFITKPFDQAELSAVVAKAAKTYAIAQRSVRPDGKARSAIVGDSPQLHDIFKIIDKVADTPSTVLITGESGTGKELVATALHEGSGRRAKPLIKINCAAIPKDLMESELFGYERGAFTGAVTSKPGRFELADGGSLFLDEIGEIPIEMQVKLLRALQESEFERVGGIKTTRVDVRLIAATNRDLLQEIEAGRFRKDLYYRLAVVPIQLPPLRERHSDIPMLARHFVEKYNKRLNKRIEGISDEAMTALQAYSWPGNIRELENLMERVLVFADGPQITLRDLPEPIRPSAGAVSAPAAAPAPAAHPPAAAAPVPASPPPEPATPPPSSGEGGLKEIVKQRSAEIEKEIITKALEEHDWNVTRTAKHLQISRKSLQTKMKEFGLRDSVEDTTEGDDED
ncbi:MAG TPA: sigma-54 dependent transcriptional regulator [Myxococcaceae bacterium]|nr:sigma-54 dependent transcriptional regulator [Myxococcaceae bacterium]